jgi:hypothetical protein
MFSYIFYNVHTQGLRVSCRGWVEGGGSFRESQLFRALIGMRMAKRKTRIKQREEGIWKYSAFPHYRKEN